MSPNVEQITEPVGLGEGPFWNAQQQTLYYVDIVNASLHSCNNVTKEQHSVKLGNGNTVSLVVQVEGQNDIFVVSINNDIAVVTWDGVSSKPSSVEIIASFEGNEDNTRINDGKVDPAGRLWAGTMGKQTETGDFVMEKGSLYRLNKDKTVSKILGKLGIANGLAWSADNKKFYYIDSLKLRVDSYDYDISTGNIANEKTLFCFKKNNVNGFPDGMTIDEEGKLWVACYEGGQMSPNIEAVTEPIVIGEGPFWNSKNQTLYYVGYFDASIHSYNSVTKEHRSVKIGGDGDVISLVIPVEGQDDKYLATVTNDIVLVTWDGISSKPSSVEVIATIEGKEEKVRINDGKVDPAGRLWTGTMGPRNPNCKSEGMQGFELEKGSLYSLNKDMVITKHLDKINMSNGLAWSLDNKKIYYIDTLELKVFSFDYDIVTGKIGNRKTIFCYKENNINGYPDGMTIDNEGKLWVACFDGAQILRIDPDSGKLLYTLKLPAQQVTSVTFGGPNLDELYATTAKISLSKEVQEKYPNGGSIFKVTNLGVKGTPSLRMKL